MRVPHLSALSEFDVVARDSRNLAPVRVCATILVIPLVHAALNWPTALIWGAAQLVIEAACWLSAAPMKDGQKGTTLQRLLFTIATICGACCWLGLSLVFWQDPKPGGQFTSLIIWAALLVNATTFAFRSAQVFLVLAMPVTLVLTLTPFFLPKFSGAQQTLVSFGAVIFAGYAYLSARRNVVAAKMLAQTREALERERHAAEVANRAKSNFLATMSHEIRTPLNGVIGMAQAMARDDLPTVQRERLAVIRSGGEALLSLLNDLLDLSRIEAGRLEIEDGVVDVAEVARSAQAAFTSLAADKDIYLSLTVAPDARGLWQGDPTRVRQILYNLVSNAVKFTARGSVQIDVAHNEGVLSLSVADTGPGVPADRLEALFDKFVQADASTTRRFGGSGLGLSICRELAGLMGGTVTVASAVGEGSTFTLILPMTRAAMAEEPAAAPAAAVDCHGLRVLAAEDNPMNQQVLSTLLTQLGVEVVVVGDGEQAVHASAEGGFDLILMDVQMPVMDGPTAARAIRTRDLETGRRTPILALTANAMSHHAAEYQDAGMDGLVAKPIQVERLVAEMERVLELLSTPPFAVRELGGQAQGGADAGVEGVVDHLRAQA